MNTVAKDEQGNVASPTPGFKGKKSAADPSKPATVPLAKNNTTAEIKNNTGRASEKTKLEIKSDEDKTPQQRQVPSLNANQTNGSAGTSRNQSTETNTLNPTGIQPSQDAPSSNTKGSSNNTPPPPTKEKMEMTEAQNECMEMLKGIEEKSTASEMLKSISAEQRNQIGKLEEEVLIPRGYNANKLVMDLWYGKMLKQHESRK